MLESFFYQASPHVPVLFKQYDFLRALSRRAGALQIFILLLLLLLNGRTALCNGTWCDGEPPVTRSVTQKDGGILLSSRSAGH